MDVVLLMGNYKNYCVNFLGITIIIQSIILLMVFVKLISLYHCDHVVLYLKWYVSLYH
jgi:hypothetical protein